MPPAGPAQDQLPWHTATSPRVRHRRRARNRRPEGAMLYYRIAGRVFQVVVGAEPEIVVLLLRRGVHPPTLVAGERALLVIGRDDVLPQLGADSLDQVPAVPDEGKLRSSACLR